ncbi:sporulation protein YpjB [Paenibacillus yanchengensis]|uniref:Sporulation protein YpjB n=1 Tax=Paenibacillus yanchengensis TaxID=2035833 RepID=A0ABW4YK45_9BACL
MKVRVAVLLTISILLFSGSFFTLTRAYAADPTMQYRDDGRLLQQVESTMQMVYVAATNNNRQAGYLELDKLRQLSDRIAERKLKRNQVEQAAYWKNIAVESRLIMNTSSDSVLSGRWYQQISALKLAVDALVRPNEALWLQYDRLLLEDIHYLRQLLLTANSSDLYAVQAVMKGMQQKIDRIKLAVEMSKQQYALPAVEERLLYTAYLMEQQPYASKEMRNQIVHSISALEKTINHLFPVTTTAITSISVSSSNEKLLFGWSLFIGGIITLILSLTVWRKYRIQPYGMKPL